jgi:hypothetical protein
LVTPEWAGALVSASVLDFFQTTPGSVLGALVSYATTLRLTSPVKAPGHVAPSEAATFIGEHPPIPLIRGTLDNGPEIRTQKLAVIVLATRELLAAGAGVGASAMLQAVSAPCVLRRPRQEQLPLAQQAVATDPVTYEDVIRRAPRQAH